MSYGDNLLTNPSAETQDMTGWTYDSVTVEENFTQATIVDVYIKDLRVTMEPDVYIGIDEASGEYAFVFASDSDAYMTQILYASDVGDQPTTFQFNCKFKMDTAQDPWDNSINGFAKLTIAYDDGTYDYFTIPLVRGLDHVDRNLFDFWLLVQNVCVVDANKTLSSVTVGIYTFEFAQHLRVDYVELRKEEEA